LVYLKLSSHPVNPPVSRRGSLRNWPMARENLFNGVLFERVSSELKETQL
jgi:hypothetical protein